MIPVAQLLQLNMHTQSKMKVVSMKVYDLSPLFYNMIREYLHRAFPLIVRIDNALTLIGINLSKLISHYVEKANRNANSGQELAHGHHACS